MKKFLSWSLSIIGVIVLFLGLCFSVFSLDSVSFKFHNNTTRFSAVNTQTQIINNANFNYNSSVFFMDKQAKIKLLEKSVPYLKIINIETKFPNAIIIHSLERESLYNVKFQNGYYICDSDLKILEITDEEFTSNQNNNILIKPFTNLPLNLSIGDFIDIEETLILKNISPALELTNRNISMQKSIIKEIKILNYNNSLGNILEITDFNNLKIQISKSHNKLAQKFNFMFYEQSKNIDSATHYLYIYEDLDGNILCEKKAFETI